MSKKAVSITDLSNRTEVSSTLPSIRSGYKGPSSGFIQKVKVLNTRNAVVYLPTLHTTLSEYHFQRSKTLTKDGKSPSKENIQYTSRQSSPTVPVTTSYVNFPTTSYHTLKQQSQKPVKSMSRSLPNLPDILQQQFCSTNTKISTESLNKGKFPPINLSPRHKVKGSSSHSTEPGFSKKSKNLPVNQAFKNSFRPDPQQQFQRTQTNLLHNPKLSFMVSGRSVTNVKEKDHEKKRKWKKGCECLRCDLIQQQYKEQDMSAYHMWGNYPCNHSEQCQAENTTNPTVLS